MLDYLRSWGITKTTTLAALNIVSGICGLLMNDSFIQSYPKVISGLITINGGAILLCRLLTDSPVFPDKKKLDFKSKKD